MSVSNEFNIEFIEPHDNSRIIKCLGWIISADTYESCKIVYRVNHIIGYKTGSRNNKSHYLDSTNSTFVEFRQKCLDDFPGVNIGKEDASSYSCVAFTSNGTKIRYLPPGHYDCRCMKPDSSRKARQDTDEMNVEFIKTSDYGYIIKTLNWIITVTLSDSRSTITDYVFEHAKGEVKKDIEHAKYFDKDALTFAEVVKRDDYDIEYPGIYVGEVDKSSISTITFTPQGIKLKHIPPQHYDNCKVPEKIPEKIPEKVPETKKVSWMRIPGNGAIKITYEYYPEESVLDMK